MQSIARLILGIGKAIFMALIWIVIMPVVLFALLLIFIPATCSAFIERRRWKRALRAAGRIQSIDDILRSQASGTFILDRPSLGWNIDYCWWTADDIHSLAPMPIPTDSDRKDRINANDDGKLSHPFDRWVYRKYLSKETGTAILLSTRAGKKLKAKLQAQQPPYKSISTWSGPCEVEMDEVENDDN